MRREFLYYVLFAVSAILLLRFVNTSHSLVLDSYYFPDSDQNAYVFYADRPGTYFIHVPFDAVAVTDVNGRLYPAKWYTPGGAASYYEHFFATYRRHAMVLFVDVSGIPPGGSRTYLVLSAGERNADIFAMKVLPTQYVCSTSDTSKCSRTETTLTLKGASASYTIPYSLDVNDDFAWGVLFDVKTYGYRSPFSFTFYDGDTPNIRFNPSVNIYENGAWKRVVSATQYGGKWITFFYTYDARTVGSSPLYAIASGGDPAGRFQSPSYSPTRAVYDASSFRGTIWVGPTYFFYVPRATYDFNVIDAVRRAYLITIHNNTSTAFPRGSVVPVDLSHVGVWDAVFTAYRWSHGFVVTVDHPGKYYVFPEPTPPSGLIPSERSKYYTTNGTSSEYNYVASLSPVTFHVEDASPRIVDYNSGVYSFGDANQLCYVRAFVHRSGHLYYCQYYQPCSELNLSEYFRDCSTPKPSNVSMPVTLPTGSSYPNYVVATVRRFGTFDDVLSYLVPEPPVPRTQAMRDMYVMIRNFSAPEGSCVYSDLYMIPTDGNYPITGATCMLQVKDHLYAGTSDGSGAFIVYGVHICADDPFTVVCEDPHGRYAPVVYRSLVDPPNASASVSSSGEVSEVNQPVTSSTSSSATTTVVEMNNVTVLKRTEYAIATVVPSRGFSGSLSVVELSSGYGIGVLILLTLVYLIASHL